ncbi:MAG: type VI secretion system baseplate subunit TssK [Gemmatimonadetes bacterium]|nr:type VI secretion system baseplate subunit TssK [Gemmatimonadota bacterium]
MADFHRIVWNEGMLLGPQHFQQAERHLLGEMGYRLRLAREHASGVRRVEIDTEALANGRFQLLALEAVLPDGTAIRLPEVDPVPTGRDLGQAFGAERSRLTVHVTLPEERPGVPRCRLPGDKTGGESRFLTESMRVRDENTPDSDTEVLIARPNVKLKLSGENLDGTTSLPIAELVKKDDGSIALDPTWSPPAIAIRAAGPLPRILRALTENLSAKADVLASQTRQGGGTVQFGASDVLLFWQLHTVNSFIPMLAHFHRTPDAHPVDAYLALARLAGTLCTFAADRHPREVPAYEHEKSGACFVALEKMIRDLTDISAPTRFERIPLTREGDSLFKGNVTDERILASGYQWYLGVSGDLSEDRIRAELPGKITIGSPHNVEFLVRQALPGVAITFTAVPPRDFPIRAGRVYFRVENHGETWETVVEARSIGFYLRGQDLKGLSLELIVMEA